MDDPELLEVGWNFKILTKQVNRVALSWNFFFLKKGIVLATATSHSVWKVVFRCLRFSRNLKATFPLPRFDGNIIMDN